MGAESAASADLRFARLVEFFLRYERVAVAYSGGVDSTLTLSAAVIALGGNGVLPLYAVSPLSSAAAVAGARSVFAENYPSAALREIPVDPLLWPGFVHNGEDRCYVCKKQLYTIFKEIMASEGYAVLVDGTNRDDLQEQRPGLKALRELQVVTPLADMGLTKHEVRLLAMQAGLSNWDLPSNSCLATRVEHGRPIVEQTLRTIEKAETFLCERGYLGCRVRPREGFVVIEVQEKDVASFAEDGNRRAVRAYFQGLMAGPIMLNLTGK